MIYTRWGNEVVLTAYHGRVAAPGFAAPLILVSVQYADDGAVRHQFAHTLKADAGWREIDVAVDAVPEIVLTGDALKAALKEAE